MSFLKIASATFSLMTLLIASTVNGEVKEHEIGVLTCLTGTCARWGINTINGAELALDSINAKGGLLGQRLKLIVEDSQEDSTGKSVAAFQKLTSEQKLSFLIGPTWTPAGDAILPLLRKNPNLIMISPSIGVRRFHVELPNTFNTWPSDEIGTRKLAKHAIKNGIKTIGILSAKQPWSIDQTNHFISEFKQGGGKVLLVREPLFGAPEVRADAAALAHAHPDAILFTSLFEPFAGPRELRAAGFKGKFLSIAFDDSAIMKTGVLEGMEYVSSIATTPRFNAEYFAKFSESPGPSSGTTYDAILLIAEAVRTANTFDLAQVLKAMEQIRKIEGASGVVKIDEFGGAIIEPPIYSVINGAGTKITD